MSSASSKIVTARENHPEWSLREIATFAGCSGEYVRQVLKLEGLNTRQESACKTWTNRFSNPLKISSVTAGCVGEYQVGIDLIIRGAEVYRSMSPAAACDLVAIGCGHIARIECRSAKKTKGGKLQYSQPSDRSRYDILALVFPDGEVIYRPSIDYLTPLTNQSSP